MVYAKVQTFDKKEKVLQAIELVNGYIVTKIDELKEKYGVESEFSFLLHSSSGKVQISMMNVFQFTGICFYCCFSRVIQRMVG